MSLQAGNPLFRGDESKEYGQKGAIESRLETIVPLHRHAHTLHGMRE